MIKKYIHFFIRITLVHDAQAALSKNWRAVAMRAVRAWT